MAEFLIINSLSISPDRVPVPATVIERHGQSDALPIICPSTPWRFSNNDAFQNNRSISGGCAIGARPVDVHLKGLRKLGAKFKIKNGYILASAKNGLVGKKIRLEKISVGATENLIMAACLAKGKTIIENAAREPEVTDLVLMLRSMGADIEGEGTSEIIINGVDSLHSTDHSIIGDRIVAGTYLLATAAVGGSVLVKGCLLYTSPRPRD